VTVTAIEAIARKDDPFRRMEPREAPGRCCLNAYSGHDPGVAAFFDER
jgi:hypothetical protein